MARTAEQQLDEVVRDFEGTAYRLVKPLAHGGMGSVFVAEHVKLDRRVVIKLLLPAFSKDPQTIERLVLEGRVLANVEHPNLVKVTDLSVTPGGRAFIAMELVNGSTLRQILDEKGALPVHEAVDLVLQLLAGLDAAHRAQVVHRDVKLDNIFICEPDEKSQRVLKLLDFGIAKVLSASLRGEPKFQTAEGTIMGTPLFMSPEQALAKAVDARSDIYSAGVVLFRAVTGQYPFVPEPTLDRDRAFFELFKMQVEKPAPVPSSMAGQPVPRELDAAILKALAKQPAERHQTAATFAEALKSAVAGAELGPKSSPIGRTERIGKTEQVPPTAREQFNDTVSDAAPTALRWAPPARALRRRRPSPVLYVVVALASAGLFSVALNALLNWVRAR